MGLYRDHPGGIQRMACAHGGQLYRAVVKDRGAQGNDILTGLKHPYLALGGNGGKHLRPPWPVQPVGNPYGFEAVVQVTHGSKEARHGCIICGGGLPWFRRQARQAGRPGLRRLEHGRFGGGQADHSGRAPLAPGFGQQCLYRLCLARPFGRRGPGTIQQNQQGVRCGLAFGIGVQHRTGQTDDHGGHRQHPQQQQPPWRAVGNAFLILQAQQQRHAGKAAAHRRGWHGSQQDPQQRQGEKGQQQPWRGETYAAKYHVVPLSSACQIHSKADCAEA